MAKRSVKKSKYPKRTDTYKMMPEAQKRQYVIEALNNPYTEDISKDETRILYTGEFYARMKELLDQGKTAVEAYEACGYDTKKLGKQRAEAAANKAREFTASSDLHDWRNYSGMTDLEDILKVKDPEAVKAMLVAKIKVMEAVDEAQKKIMPGLLEKYMRSNQNPKR